MKKLLVIDGNSIINRAFYGIRALTAPDGSPTNAIYGAVNMVWRQLSALSPDYAAVAFDVHAPTFRHQLFPEYKAGRRPTPPDLLAQFDGFKACLSAMGVSVLELPGYEADDIQGTLARMAADAKEATEAYIFSGDRDLLQLIDDRITVLLAGNSETLPYRADTFRQKYGIDVSAFLDLKALMGDSSDNIPGVPGVGEKTAVKLLCDFGSIDGIYENLDDPRISASLRKKLESGKESASLSRVLAKIDTCVPLGITLADVAWRGIDNDSLYKLFTGYAFSNLIRQLSLRPPQPTDTEAKAAVPAPTYLEADAGTLLAASGRLAIEIADDTVAVATEGAAYLYSGPLADIAALFSGDREIVCYDGKALLHRLADAGIEVARESKLLDLMLYAYLIRPGDGQSKLASLSLAHLGISPSENAPAAHLLLSLEPILRKKVEEIGGLPLLFEIELPLLRVLYEIERVGFMIDRAGMEALGEKLKADAAIAEERIWQMAGYPFNIQSPKQLGEVLFGELGLPGAKKTKTGYSTNAEVLEELRADHPIVSEILEYRQLTKLYSTYAVGLIAAADENDRIHTEFRQALTATGRLSSSEPNLQNIPVRTELGKNFRRLFVAGEGMVLVDADYSQIELRLLAHIAGDEEMLTAFRSGVDIHTTCAASVFHVPEGFVTPEMRKFAKAVNFGIMYGIGAYSLSKDLHISVAEAKRYIESYKASYPGVSAYLDRVIAEASERGYTETLFCRRRYIPELKSQNKMTQAFGRRIAMNSPIQGSSADIMKLAMIRVAARLRDEVPEAHLVMQVHDELIVEAPKEKAEIVSRILKSEMESTVTLSLPLTTDVSIGKTWAE